MMGFGSLGVGGPLSSSSSSSSSSSNLSALAPPFTVDRFNPKSSSNPLLQFSDLPPYTDTFGHTWKFSTPSAPRPDMYPTPELEIDSTRTTPVPLANDYRFRYSVSQPNDRPWSIVNPSVSAKTSSGPFLYDCKVETYFPPYVSSVVNDSPLVVHNEPSYDMLPSSGLVSVNVSSQLDYTQSLSGLEYTPCWPGVWNGSVDAKRDKMAEIDVGFSMDKTNIYDSRAYGNQMNRGCHTVECGDILEEHSGISCGLFSDAIGRESNNGLVSMEHMDNMSRAAQKVLSVPSDSSRTTISTSSFIIPASQPPGLFLHSPKNFMNHQKPQNTYEKCIIPPDPSISGSISAINSSPGLVIRLPPFGSASVSQKVLSGKIVDTGNVGAVHQNEVLGKNNLSKGKEPQTQLNSEVEEGSLFKSQLKYKKEGSGLVFTSSVMGERSSKPQTGDGLENVFNVKSGCQVPNINVSDGSSLSGDNFQAIHSSNNLPDCLDHHNFAVDSPCWKGAPASHFSSFDVIETETTHPFVKKLDKFCRLDLQVDQTFSPVNDPIRFSFEKAGEDKVHEYGHAGSGISPIPGKNSEADYTAREQRSVDAAKARFKNPILTNSKGVQFCEENIKPGEDYDLPKHSKKDSVAKSSGSKQLGVEEDNLTTSELNFQAAVMDSGLNISDTTEGAVAVRAAENVLCSPSSEEGVPEQAKPYRGESAPKMDVQALITGLRSVSELLLFNYLTDLCALKDEDIEVLKHVMSNLDTLVSKENGHLTQTQEPILHRQTCDKVGELLDPHLSNAAVKPQFENEAGVKSYGHLDYQHTHEEIRNHSVSNEKADNFQPLFSLRDDLDVLRDDNMAQAIRKVLEENFRSEEEMEPESLLFKNLWLEAEAKLCSITYRARFDRMKIEMQKFSSNRAKENSATSEDTPNCSSSHDLNVSDVPSPKVENDSMEKTTILNLHSLNSTSNLNDVEVSVMSRFHVLKCRDDLKSTKLVGKEVDDVYSSKMPFRKDQVKDGRLDVAPEPLSPKKGDVNQDHVAIHVGGSGNELFKDGFSSSSNTDDVEDSVMTRLHILKCRDDSKTTNSVGQQGMVDSVYSGIMPFLKDQIEDGILLNVALGPQSHQTDYVNQGHVGLHVDVGGGSGYESMKDFFLSVPDDPVTQSSATCGQRNQCSLGFNDNSSLDWEHVLKDDVSWL